MTTPAQSLSNCSPAAAMEDAHTAKMKLDESKSDHDADAFFAVFDGHGGALYRHSTRLSASDW